MMKPALPLLALAVVPAMPADHPEPKLEMTTYYVGLLYRGPKWTPEGTPQTQALHQAHLANIGRLAKEGELLLGSLEEAGKPREADQ